MRAAGTRARRSRKSLAARLVQLRRERGVSRRQLASDAGLSYRMLAAYELEGALPPATVLPRLARALAVSVDDLLREVGAEPPSRVAAATPPRPAKRGRKPKAEGSSFGRHLAALRRRAGMTQAELGSALGISQRAIAYYEAQNGNPPVALLPKLAKTLGVGAEELLGSDGAPVPSVNLRLSKRLQRLDDLSERERGKLVELIDAFLERHDLKQRLRERGGEARQAPRLAGARE